MRIAGVEITNPERELWPGSGVRKEELVAYYDAVRGRLLPQLRDRPLSVMRYHGGPEGFMQKDLPDYAPDWIRTARVWAPSARREVDYALCNDRRTLLWLANQRSVELHPGLARRDLPDRPTHLVLDIDPPEGKFDRAVEGARVVRDVLEEAGLKSCAKTSGSKGVHVYVPLRRRHTFEEAGTAARRVAADAATRLPRRLSVEVSKAKRRGRVLLDWTRMRPSQTVVVVYGPRGRAGLPVSFPVPWDRLGDVRPGDFTIGTVPALLARSDPWTELCPGPQSLPRDLLAA